MGTSLVLQVLDKFYASPDDGARKKIRGSAKLIPFILRGHKCVLNFITVQSIFVERFHSESQTSTSWVEEKSWGRFDTSSGQQ